MEFYIYQVTRKNKLSDRVKIIVIGAKYLHEITVKRKTPNKKSPENQ
jgi:hypothetical protein